MLGRRRRRRANIKTTLGQRQNSAGVHDNQRTSRFIHNSLDTTCTARTEYILGDILKLF